MYSNPTILRDLAPLLRQSLTNSSVKTLLEKDLLLKIISADSKIDKFLSSTYKIPIQPKTAFFCTGTISTTKPADPDIEPIDNPYNLIVGVGTSFLTELKFGDIIQVFSTKEALQVIEIIDDENIIVSSNSNFTSNNSTFFIIPAAIADISGYLAVKKLLMSHFSEQAYSQETIPMFKEYEKEIKPVLDDLISGNMIFNQLEPAAAPDVKSRLMGYVNPNENRNNYFISKIEGYYN